VRYVLQARDTRHAGTFDVILTVCYPTDEMLTWPSSPNPHHGLTMTIGYCRRIFRQLVQLGTQLAALPL
jgi:hypothetical protein